MTTWVATTQLRPRARPEEDGEEEDREDREGHEDHEEVWWEGGPLGSEREMGERVAQGTCRGRMGLGTGEVWRWGRTWGRSWKDTWGRPRPGQSSAQWVRGWYHEGTALLQSWEDHRGQVGWPPETIRVTSDGRARWQSPMRPETEWPWERRLHAWQEHQGIEGLSAHDVEWWGATDTQQRVARRWLNRSAASWRNEWAEAWTRGAQTLAWSRWMQHQWPEAWKDTRWGRRWGAWWAIPDDPEERGSDEALRRRWETVWEDTTWDEWNEVMRLPVTTGATTAAPTAASPAAAPTTAPATAPTAPVFSSKRDGGGEGRRGGGGGKGGGRGTERGP
jgi:hypothetical protein